MSVANSRMRTFVLGLALILLAVVGVKPAMAQAAAGKVAFSKGSQIYVMNIDGTNATNLTNDGDNNQYPSMSPDGNWIAFSSNSGLYIMKADGSNPDGTQNPLPLITSNIYSPRLSSPDKDGNITVVFIRQGAGAQQIWSLKVDSNGLLVPDSEARIYPTSTTNDTSPCISPDGTTVAFVRGSGMNDGEIYTYNFATQVLAQVTTLGSAARSWHPSFSPDGKKIVFYSNVGFDLQTGVPDIDSAGGTNQIYTYDLTTQQLTHVEQIGNYNTNDRVPSFTSDGNHIAFLNYSNNSTLWVTTLDGLVRSSVSPEGFTAISDPDCGMGIVPTPPPLPPVLTSPKDKATGVPAGPLTLSWIANSKGAIPTGYILQYSTVKDFTVNPRTILGITETSTVINTPQYQLLPGQTYYWRVKAINVSVVSGTQYSVWQVPFSITMGAAPPPSAPVLNSPANNAVNVALQPTLSWQAVATATKYDVQMSFIADFSGVVYDVATGINALSFKLPTALHGNMKYYWRIRGVNGDLPGNGGNGDWSVPFSFTTIVPPAAPVLLNPTTNATGISVPSFTFSWMPVSGATSYLLSIINTDTGVPALTGQSVMGTNYLYNGLVANTGYSWSVIAVNGAGPGTAATGIFHTVTPPAAPTLISPIAPSNTNITLPALLRWTSVTGATSYSIEVSTSSQFTTLVTGYPVSTSSISYTASNLANGTTYYWRVASVNKLGAGAPAAAASFTTKAAAPSVPVLYYPANYSSINSTSVTLGWSAVAGTGVKYWIQVGTDNSFSSTTLIANYDTLLTTNMQLNSMQPWRTYYWRVCSRSATGTSAWSTVWAVTITKTATSVGTISAPNLLLPTNSTIFATPGPVTFQWSAVPNIKSYSLQVTLATDTTFIRPVVNTASVDPSGAGGGTIAINGLLPDTAYIWRVKSLSLQNASSAWSSPLFSFTTAPTPTVATTAPPSQPMIIAPTYNANAPQPFNLQWRAGTTGGAPSAYILQLSQYVDMHAAVIDNKMVTSPSYQISGLIKGVRYWWHVKAVNAAGISSWSALSTFIAR